jgi:2-C-methyl-D-erythritol 4-phosphate cytidylyltransferase
MNRSVIIVAGGAGRRMKHDLPKQFMLLNGMPILMHTIRRFYTCCPDLEIIIAIPEKYTRYWDDLCNKFQFNIQHKIAVGGETRFHTVRNALPLSENRELIAIHDGVRPFASNNTIGRCFTLAAEKGTAVPCIPIPESIRCLDNNNNYPVNRDHYRLIQTPQVFQWEIIRKSYDQPYRAEFTDDASVAEKAGFPIFLTEGNYENIKITTPVDFIYAEALMKKYGEHLS